MFCSNCDKPYIYKRPFMLDATELIEVWVCSESCFLEVAKKRNKTQHIFNFTAESGEPKVRNYTVKR